MLGILFFRLFFVSTIPVYTVKVDKGKVAIGRVRYLLNIVLYTWMFESSLFRYIDEKKKKKVSNEVKA